MNPFDPFNALHLSGTGTLRYMTLVLPAHSVRDLLPYGLELAPQQMTPSGTHPVLMGFHDMFRLHTTTPSLLPSMTYHEHSVGVPYCSVTAGSTPYDPGPYFFMPAVFLDHLLATIGGLLFWGYAKQLASISNADGRYTVARVDGKPVLSVSYNALGVARPIAEYPQFELQRQALSQPIISMVPFSMGPFFVLAGFPKRWDVAMLTPLAAAIDVFTDYVLGLSSGRYPSTGRSKGIDVSVTGAYELQAPWQLTSPHPLPWPNRWSQPSASDANSSRF
jgi:hypothetical protein